MAKTSEKSTEVLVQALELLDDSAVRQLLQNDFDNVAQNEYEWLHELIEVGYSRSDIATLLMEEANDAPWIYSGPQDQLIQAMDSSSHESMLQGSLDVAFLSSPWTSRRHDIRTMVQQLCGLGGIAPISRSLQDWNGEVIFEKNFSISYFSTETCSGELL
ncbi:uncharacterized protein CC84DRAFT_1218423 [Paraphaeosphaeria sporulosa]|uniref:Uncharacterized protein n=1 Tax=Paraphaeosphaeria sporulosa TaxID=1460663 RepID=A0A177CE67_9PLEO|nr:uncharacterized protein CC84DRAFT_1218423 [Paraphaeosphaeria sporulosa]OAG05030.1 hypothetical protein CC84DRAFT_1218423 [Paraphaeosphaeria sporulosa]